MSRLRPVVSFVLLMVAARDAASAQTLRGSRSSVNKMYSRAVSSDLEFLKTSKGVYEAVKDGDLVMITITSDVMLDKVAYPFVLPKTRDFLNSFAARYHASCGERIVVTSASRPRVEQPRNASPKSVHPTGMALDFRKPAGACLTFLRTELLVLEKRGVLEATEEKHPVHFHVAVLQRAPIFTAGTVATTEPAATEPTQGTAKGTSKTAERASTYAVRRGDTQSSIAKKFGLSVVHLKSLNKLRGSTLRPGQTLRVQ